MSFLVHFETSSAGGDNRALETIEMDYVPRKGETVILRGDEYGGIEREARFEEGTTWFEVEDVTYEIDVGDKEKKDENGYVSVTVFLKLHFQDSQRSEFRARCTCKPEQRLPAEEHQDQDQCGNCGELAQWRRK